MTTLAQPAVGTFDADRHVYRIGERVLVSVTQALHHAGLIDDRFYTDFARLRGSYVHSTLEYFDQGELDEAQLHPTLAPYLDGYREFCAGHDITWDAIEQRFWHKTRGYAGTADRIGRIGDQLAVLDLKTGAPEPFHAIQLAAYARLIAELGVYGIRETQIARVGLYLTSDGKYRVTRYDDRHDFAVFQAALLVAQWKGVHDHRTAR